MTDLITDEIVEAAARLLDPDAWEMTAGDYQDTHGRSYGNAESFIRSARQIAKSEARVVLHLAAPLIAAKAWDEAVAAIWDANTTIQEPDNPYRED